MLTQADSETDPCRNPASAPSRNRRVPAASASGNCHGSRRDILFIPASRIGWTAIKPATAVKDSKKPRSPNCEGEASRIASAATASAESPSGRRLRKGAASSTEAITHARIALVAAPVVTVYTTRSGTSTANHLVIGTPSARSSPTISNDIIPTCAPEIAKI